MVLDGNSIINRAYYGVRPLTTRDGFFTHAIFGFLTMLGRLLDEEKPEALCVAFDRREPTFRHLEYEGYKATRHAMPEELAMQMPVLKDVLDAMNIPRYELAGFEADDLIGTISRKCESAGWDCVVATGDKDSLQLVTEHTTVKLISTRMGQTTTKDMTPESFREVYGFAPIHIVDLKALMGDASDNIPGVPGVGEKTAMALIQKYQSIDEIYRLLPDIEAKPNVIKKLTEGEESARQSFHLATIVTDAPLEFSPQDNLRKAPSDALYPLFMKLEFTKLIDKYGLKPPADIPAAEEPVDLTVTAEAVTTVEKAKEAGKTACPVCAKTSTTVYATSGGKYYHKTSTCSGMKNAEKTTVAAAKKRGQKACPVCMKENSDTDSTEKTNKNTYVYVTMSGNKYHAKSTCSGMKNAEKISLAMALKRNYARCTKCNAPKPISSTTPKPTATPKPDSDPDVYVTLTGTRYHADKNCSGMQNAEKISLSTALKRGYKRCTECDAPKQSS